MLLRCLVDNSFSVFPVFGFVTRLRRVVVVVAAVRVFDQVRFGLFTSANCSYKIDGDDDIDDSCRRQSCAYRATSRRRQVAARTSFVCLVVLTPENVSYCIVRSFVFRFDPIRFRAQYRRRLTDHRLSMRRRR
jgi:hypothetical protein